MTADSGLSRIVAGPDGNLWFIENTVRLIGRITPAGVVTEFAPPTANAQLAGGIAAGPDGADLVWPVAVHRGKQSLPGVARPDAAVRGT